MFLQDPNQNLVWSKLVRNIKLLALESLKFNKKNLFTFLIQNSLVFNNSIRIQEMTQLAELRRPTAVKILEKYAQAHIHHIITIDAHCYSQ